MVTRLRGQVLADIVKKIELNCEMIVPKEIKSRVLEEVFNIKFRTVDNSEDKKFGYRHMEVFEGSSVSVIYFENKLFYMYMHSGDIFYVSEGLIIDEIVYKTFLKYIVDNSLYLAIELDTVI